MFVSRFYHFIKNHLEVFVYKYKIYLTVMSVVLLWISCVTNSCTFSKFLSNQSMVLLLYFLFWKETLLVAVKCLVIRISLLMRRVFACCVCTCQWCYPGHQSCYQFSVVLLALWNAFSEISCVVFEFFCVRVLYQCRDFHRKLFVQILQQLLFTFLI